MSQAPETRPSLLVRIRDAGDGPAWTQFVQIYAPLIYTFGCKHGLQDADAADLTQEVLRTVAGAIRRLDYDPTRGTFRGWLLTVVRNELCTLQKRQARQARGTGDTDNLELLANQAAPDEALWDLEFERRLFHWAAEQVRPSVAESTWQAFWRTAVDGQKAQDVAKELGLAVAAVYMAKSRVLARLKELLQEVQAAEPPG